jgi:hypothetical protein
MIPAHPEREASSFQSMFSHPASPCTNAGSGTRYICLCHFVGPPLSKIKVNRASLLAFVFFQSIKFPKTSSERASESSCVAGEM